jgi:hypothetical protein
MNIVTYIHRCYIPRLTKEYNVPLSILKLCSSVIIDEHFIVSCSVRLATNLQNLAKFR